MSGDLFDEGHEFIASKTLFAGVSHELSCACKNEALLQRTGHGDSSATLKLEDAFLTKLMKGSKHGVGVDAEFRREILRWRQAIPGARLTIGDGPSDLGSHLMVKSRLIGAVDAYLDRNRKGRA